MERWEDYVAALCSGLSHLAITDNAGQPLTAADGFQRWVEMTHDVQTRGQNLYSDRQRRQRRDGEPFCRRRVQERRAAGAGLQRRLAADGHRQRSRSRRCSRCRSSASPGLATC